MFRVDQSDGSSDGDLGLRRKEPPSKTDICAGSPDLTVRKGKHHTFPFPVYDHLTAVFKDPRR